MKQIIDVRRTALLVIDMQNDFVEEGAVLEVKGIRDNLDDFGEFIGACRTAGVSIFYTQHVYNPQDNPIEAELFPGMSEVGLRKGTDGFEITQALNPRDGDIVVEKKRYDAFYNSNLDELLKTRGITDVIISGTMTNVCCESTARSAMYRDYRVWFLSDLTFASDRTQHEYTLKTIATHFGYVVGSEEIAIMIR